MSWERALLSLYEQNADQAGCITYKEYESKGKTVRIPNVLLPVYHTTAAAQIEVTIDEEGNFLGAEQVSQEDKLTVIPVTEKSGSRDLREGTASAVRQYSISCRRLQIICQCRRKKPEGR